MGSKVLGENMATSFLKFIPSRYQMIHSKTRTDQLQNRQIRSFWLILSNILYIYIIYIWRSSRFWWILQDDKNPWKSGNVSFFINFAVYFSSWGIILWIELPWPENLTYGNTGQLFSTLLGLLSNVYRDLHHWRSNQWPQIAEPKLYNWANSSYHAHVTSN